MTAVTATVTMTAWPAADTVTTMAVTAMEAMTVWLRWILSLSV